MLNFQILFSVIFLFLTTTFASKAEDHYEEEKDFIMEHVADSYEWHFATVGHKNISISLPVIVYNSRTGLTTFLASKLKDSHHNNIEYKGYYLDSNGKIKSVNKSDKIFDLSITKNVAAMLISVLILCLSFLMITRKYTRTPLIAPRGFWMLLEIFIYFVRDEIAVPNIGKEKANKFLPFLLTVFFFIWLNNLLGLLPGAANVTGNISVTLVLALFTFVITNINANSNYWKHIFSTPGVPKWLLPIMIPVEIIGLFTKPFSLMVRLFANITAGHIILLSIINLIFIFKTPFAGLVSVPFGTFMFLLKLLVAFLQAYVFTLLSAIYFGSAVEEHH